MYNVTHDYKNKIIEPDRVFELDIRIEHSKGTLNLSDKDIELDSFNMIDASQPGEDFTVGGTVAKHIEFTLVDKDKYEGINFIGAKVIPTVKLFLEEAIDAHFLQPSQPSKMLGFEDKLEYVPLGQFNIDIASRLRTTIEVKAIDNMILLDKPYSLSTLGYPATLSRILNDACSIAGVGTPSNSFVNSDYVVSTRPTGEFTLRNIVGFVAELAGSFAKFDRTGRLKLEWYEGTDKVITKHQRVDLKLGDFQVKITGVRFDSNEKDGDDNDISYIVGTDDYMIDLTGNELLQGQYNTVLPNILSKVEGVNFTPYSASWNGDPALDVGDIVTHIDLEGVEHRTVVTNLSYKYRGVSTLNAKALPNISRGFKSSDNRIASTIRRVEAELGSEMNNLQQEQLRATELIAGTLGGYVTEVKPEDDSGFGVGLYVHDATSLESSTKIWKWGIGGFGFSDDGGETYTTGITIDGSIVANIISANHINTGTLSSNNGETWINLDNGNFNFKNKLRWLNGELMVDGDITGSTGTFDGQVRAGNILIGGANGSISFDDLGDKPWIPQNASDVGAKPDDWVPTWAEIQEKPTILGADDIKTTVITKDWIGTLGLMVGNEIKMGDNAKISWSSVTSKPSDIAYTGDIPTRTQITNITKDAIDSHTFTGNTFRTSSSNRRVQMNAYGLRSYNASGNRHGFGLSTYGELELHNNGSNIGGIRYDTSGSSPDAPNRMFITTSSGYAMKLQSAGDMSIQSGGNIWIHSNIKFVNNAGRVSMADSLDDYVIRPYYAPTNAFYADLNDTGTSISIRNRSGRVIGHIPINPV